MLLSTPSCDHKEFVPYTLFIKVWSPILENVEMEGANQDEKLFQDFISLMIRRCLKSAYLLFLATCFNASVTFCLLLQ